LIASSAFSIPSFLVKLSELNLGLEIIYLRWRFYENSFLSQQTSQLSESKQIVIAIILVEFLVVFCWSYLYWKRIDLRLREKMAGTRFNFDHFPLEIIMKQSYIMKYLQETSNLLLK
jgi:hypothetical protein